MNNQTVTILGATGLIGSHILEYLQNDPNISEIRVILRRPIAYTDSKTQAIVIDFADHDAFKSALEGSDIVFCAIGTTNKKVKGDQEAYKKVDYDIPVNAAKYSLAAGASKFLLVSALGANYKSQNFYLNLKGKVEEAIMDIGLPTVCIFRPSLLLGKRNEFRLAERLGTIFMPPLSFLVPSNMKPIYGQDVAKAMVAAAQTDIKGSHIFHYKEMMELTRV